MVEDINTIHKIKKGKIGIIMAVCLAVFGICVTVTHSFLSKATNQAENVITVGKVKLSLTESEFDPKTAEYVIPPADLIKNPAITNTGKNPMWAFLTVTIPKREVSLVNEDNRKMEQEYQELFDFETELLWELVDREEDKNHSCEIYTYGYINCLQPGETTTSLFEQIHMKNILEGELNREEPLIVGIQAYGIQNQVSQEDNIYLVYNELKGAVNG